MARSHQLEQESDPGGAAALLEGLADDYPQDYTLFLRLGWLRFSAGDYRRGKSHYERALSISPEAADARLGRGWCLYYLGRKQKAREDFARVLEQNADSDSAMEGMKLTRRVSYAGVILTGAYHYFDGHPTKIDGKAFSISAPFVVRDNYLLGGTWRRTAFSLATGNGLQSYWNDSLDFVQNEGYLYAGVSYPLWGATAQYAYLDNDSADDQQGHIAGTTLRFSPWGSILCSANGSFYDASNYYRGSLEWGLPFFAWLSVRPGMAWQYADEEHLFTGSLALEGLVSRFNYSVWGRYGTERHPAYLNDHQIYNLPDDLLYAGGASLSAMVGGGFHLGGAYEYRRLELAKDDTSAESDFHLWALFVRWTATPGDD